MKFCNNLFNSSKRIIFLKFLYSLCIVILCVLSFFVVAYSSKSDGEKCINDYYKLKSLSKVSVFNNDIQDINNNDIIIIGDSRMRFLANDSNVNCYSHVSFIAKGGTRINWFVDEAVPQLDNILSNINVNNHYHVILNMGVNDLNVGGGFLNVSNNYYSVYRKIALKYPNVKFYILSINPIDEEIYYSYYKNAKVSNNKIIRTNFEMLKLIEKDNLENVNYCDSFHSLNFNIPDGIHYDSTTSQQVVDYIVNDCIKYE